MKGCYNYREISEKVSTSGATTAEELLSLSENQYEAVINLLPDANEQAVEDEKTMVESQGLLYFHIPVDFLAPKESEYQEFSQIMDSCAGKKLHIHCAANWRVSAFYGIYATEKGIWSVETALDFIQSLWNPNEHQVWQKLLLSHGIDTKTKPRGDN